MQLERPKELALQADLDHANRWISSTRSKALLETALENSGRISSIVESLPPIEDSEDISIHIKAAEDLIAAKCFAEAELLLISLSLLSPYHAQAMARLALFYETQSAYQHTVSCAKLLLEANDQNAEAIYQLSFALYRLGRSDEAIEYLLPQYISNPSQRNIRLFGLLLKALGQTEDAINVLATAAENDSTDVYSIKALSEIYTEIGLYQKSLDTLRLIPRELQDTTTRIYEAIIFRFMGNTRHSITLLSRLIPDKGYLTDILWPQCFNYSIAGASFSKKLLTAATQYWSESGYLLPDDEASLMQAVPARKARIRIGFLTGDIGEHVVSRFLAPLLRSYHREDIFVALFSTVRRFEQKGLDIASLSDCAFSLEEMSLTEARACMQDSQLDIIIETNGFTKNSGLAILGQRCAPVQCHYIGYHATTGLKTLDYFLGDSITTPNEFQWQYTERLAQIPRLWMAYDPKIEFPEALGKTKRESPVFGAFSQVAKLNSLTLQYWGAAMMATPDSILVLKDRGLQCPTTRKRIEKTFAQLGVNPDRIYLFGPVGSHLDHLDSYNAIDIALDTTPWSGATTAFEALGMGVPLVTICGDTTSGRMSTSVVNAAGRSHWIAHSKEDFARIAAELAEDYQQIRKNKASMQKEIRSGILFDEQRICRDFFATIDKLISNR